MREHICDFCSARQPFDPRPGARCLNCGGPVKAPRRCYGCGAVVPPNPACPKCGTPTVDLELYPAAVMLAARGTALADVAGRLTNLELGERERLEREYRGSWLPVDDLLDRLAQLVGDRTGPKMLEMALQAWADVKRRSTPEAALPALRQALKTWEQTPPTRAPWPHGLAKAVLEAAPLKLDRLRGRLDRPRGADDSERGNLRQHAEVLASTMETASLGCAYLNSIAYGRHLVLGEAARSHDPRPVMDLYEAARGREPADLAVPAMLVRDRGVLWALGPRPSHEVLEPWTPEGFAYAPFDGAPVAIDGLDGLRASLRANPIPIETGTLDQLIHWLMAPFPWTTRVEPADKELLDAWHALAIENENLLWANREAERKVGVDRSPRIERRDELVLKLEPLGATLVYRPPEVELRGPEPAPVVLPPLRSTEAPLPETSAPEAETACGNCGVRTSWAPGQEANCPSCGAPPDAGTRCFSCFERVPPNKRCPSCGLDMVPMRLYDLALKLRADGVDLGAIAATAKSIHPTEQAAVEARYAANWRPVDAAMQGLRDSLKKHYDPSVIDHMVDTVRLHRWSPGVTPAAALQFIRQVGGVVRKVPAVAPFPPEICKAMHEAAPVARSRLESKGARGLAPDDRGRVAQRMSASTTDADFTVGEAYLQELSSRHAFVWGEAKDDATAIFELAEAAKRLPGIPVTLVRGRGVILAQGPPPTADVNEPWSPTGFVYAAGDRRVELHQREGLAEFLAEMDAPITPATIPFLVHVLLAPFPWSSRYEETTGWIRKWRAAKPSGLKRLLGAFTGPKELVLRVEPEGATVTYRKGRVDFS